MIPRKQFDISFVDLFYGMACSFFPQRIKHRIPFLQNAWATQESILPCLSIRSGFDATLSALNLEKGSEILTSAFTIRDMGRILRHHDLVPVPVDVDFTRMEVDMVCLKKAVTPKSKGILVAHLFGSRMNMDPIIDFAKQHQLFVFEDCAQAFIGKSYTGDPRSDVRMFSFGPIKTATALGGGVLWFKQAAMRDSVEHIQDSWPIQPRLQFFLRALKYCLFHLLTQRGFYSLFVRMCAACGTSHDRVIGSQVRGFASNNFFKLIRRQASEPLIRMMARRIEQCKEQDIEERQQRGSQTAQNLTPENIPGHLAQHHSYWVFPYLSDHPDQLVQYLSKNGFDATRGQSSMAVLEASSKEHQIPKMASKAFDRLLYLPVHRGISEKALERLVAHVNAFEVQNQSPQNTDQRQ